MTSGGGGKGPMSGEGGDMMDSRRETKLVLSMEKEQRPSLEGEEKEGIIY